MSTTQREQRMALTGGMSLLISCNRTAVIRGGLLPITARTPDVSASSRPVIQAMRLSHCLATAHDNSALARPELRHVTSVS